MSRSVRYKYIQIDRDRHGRERVYFRRGRGHLRIRITEEWGSPAFHRRYRELLAGGTKVRSGQSEDRDLRPSSRGPVNKKAGFVYFLILPAAVKVGFTTNPRERLKSLQHGAAHDPSGFVCVKGSLSDEKALHIALHKFRTRGEWYKRSEAVMRLAGDAAINQTIRLSIVSEVLASTRDEDPAA